MKSNTTISDIQACLILGGIFTIYAGSILWAMAALSISIPPLYIGLPLTALLFSYLTIKFAPLVISALYGPKSPAVKLADFLLDLIGCLLAPVVGKAINKTLKILELLLYLAALALYVQGQF